MKLERFKKYFMIGLLLSIVFLVVSCRNSANNGIGSANSSVDTLVGKKVENKLLQNDPDSQKLQETATPKKTLKPSDNEVIYDIANWNHPVKNVFSQYNIKIGKIELLNNKVFPVFYVEIDPDYLLDSRGAKYYEVLMNKIALANGYWDFKVVDDKNKLVFSVECDKGKKTVTDIVTNGKKGLLREMIDYNNEMISKGDQAVEYLTQNVPEVKQYQEQILKDSKEKVTLIMRLDGLPDKYSDDHYKDYYCIYVGESHPDRTVRWNSFYIHKDFDLILVEDIVTSDLISLNQWRENTIITEISSTSKNFEKAINISEEEALEIINGLIEQKKIKLTEPNCQVQYFYSKNIDNVIYYVIRIAYIDPNNKDYTKTLARYLVSNTSGDVFDEDLYTGNLSKILE